MAFSSRWWEIKREICIVQATLITSHSIVYRKFKLPARSWCIQPWVAASRSIKCPNQKPGLSKHRRALDPSSTQRPRNTWSKWTKYRKREPNRLLRLDLQIWCLISRTTTWTNMPWPTALSLILWSTRTNNRTSEELKVNLPLRE